MYRGFNLNGLGESFFIGKNASHLKSTGIRVIQAEKTLVQEGLKSITGNSATLDGQSIKDSWFPTVSADIFISHSHRNEDLALMFAGWLWDTFNLTSFIDSSIWGYSADLLRLIDDEYCLNDGGDTYSYQLRNASTSHVHMMLATALGMMIHHSECLFFLNTPQSIEPDDVIKNGTKSPWIYTELMIAGIIEERIPPRFKYRHITAEANTDVERRQKGIKYTLQNREYVSTNKHRYKHAIYLGKCKPKTQRRRCPR